MSWSFRKGGEDERGTGTVGGGGHRVSPGRLLSVYGDAPDRGEQSDPEVEVVHVAAGDHDAPDPQQHAGPACSTDSGSTPEQRENGGYQQHFDTQQQPGFTGYQQGPNYPDQPSAGERHRQTWLTRSPRVS